MVTDVYGTHNVDNGLYTLHVLILGVSCSLQIGQAF